MTIEHNQLNTFESLLTQACNSADEQLRAIDRGAPMETIQMHAIRTADSIEAVARLFQQCLDASRKDDVPMTVDQQAG